MGRQNRKHAILQLHNETEGWWEKHGLVWIELFIYFGLLRSKLASANEREGERVQFPLMAREGEQLHLANWHASIALLYNLRLTWANFS